MSSLRQDLLTGRWVILAEDRGKRPNDFPISERPVSDPAECPFCPGHEYETPSEVLVTGRADDAAANSPGWNIRVFPNKYPAVSPNPDQAIIEHEDNDLFPQIPGHGRHEVIVYSSVHSDGPATINADHFLQLLHVIRNRYRSMAALDGVRYVLPFWNHGSEAGATLSHPHLQMVASSLVPVLVEEKAERQLEYYREHGHCLLCQLRELEIQRQERIVKIGEHFTCLTPWASRMPYEMIVLPNQHQSRFADVSDAELVDLAQVLGYSLRGLLAVNSDPPMNIIIHEAPLAVLGDAGYGELSKTTFHWHLEVLPRLSRMAGFEAGTGFTINSISAEKAARTIRGEGS